MLDPNRLRILRAVVASGSINETARRLGYTPSTVSQHVKTLEKEVGFRLVERVGRGIVPTAAASELARASVDVLDAMGRLDATARGLREGATERLTLRTFASAAYTWMPTIARSLRQDFPGTTLELSINETDAPEGVGIGRADVEIHTEVTDAAPLAVAGYRRVELCLDDFLVALPLDHPLVGADHVDLAEFSVDDWIQYDFRDEVATGLTARSCAQAGFAPHYVVQAQDHVSGLAFVAAGVGIALLPELAVGWSSFDVAYVRPRNPTPQRRISVLVRNATAATPAVVRILELLDGLARQLRMRDAPS